MSAEATGKQIVTLTTDVRAFDASRQEVFHGAMYPVPRVGEMVQVVKDGKPKRFEVLQVLWLRDERTAKAMLSVREMGAQQGSFPGVD